MNLKFSITSASIFLILICYDACTPRKALKSTCSPVPTYSADIKTIIDINCASSCHSAEKKKHNIDLSTYELVKEESGHGAFLGSIRHENGYDAMPQKHDKLDEATIQKIVCWIQSGTPK